MSIEALGWAMKHMQNEEMESSTKFVLMFMANRADPEGALYPSVRYIQRHTSLSEATIRRASQDLRDRGLLVVTQQLRPDGGKTSNHYQLRLDTPPPVTMTPTPPVMVRPTHPSPRGGAPVMVTGHDTKVRDNPPLKGKGRRDRRTPLPDDFKINDRVKAWAANRNIHPSYVKECFDAFTSDARAHGRVYVDWDEALMGWIRRQQTFTKQPPPPAEDRQCRWTARGREVRCSAQGTKKVSEKEWLCEPHHEEATKLGWLDELKLEATA